MRSFKQIASLVRGEDILEEGKKSLGTGWMLKADPKLGKAVKDKIDLAKKRQATYGDKSAGKSVKEETIEEAGLWDNIHAKRERIKKGSGERMRKPGSEGAPSEKDLKNSQTNEEVELTEADGKDYHSVHVNGRHWKTFDTKSHAENVAKKVKGATVHKYDAERLQQNYGAKAAARNAARGKQYDESVEVEQLDELNKDTLSSYVTKAKTNYATQRKRMSRAYYQDVDKYDDATVKSNARKKGLASAKAKLAKEEVEQLEEMPGANMDTRAVHQHLKKRGWKLSRTSGSHDVYTHPEAKHHIPVPRHRQLKAPLVKGILKQAEINEQAESDTTEKTEMAQTQLHFIKYAAEEILEFIEMGGEIEEWYQNKLSKVQSDVESLHSYVEGESRRTGMKEEVDPAHKKILDRAKTSTPKSPKSEYDRKVEKYLKKKHGMKEEVEQIDELSKKTLGSYVNKAMDSARELPGAGTNAEASKKTKRYAAVSAAAYRTQGLAPRKGTDMFKKYKAESVVAEGEKQSNPREMDLDWHYKNIINTKGLSDKAKKDTTDIYNKLKKNKEQGVAEEVGQTSNSNENPDAGRFTSGPAKKPMKPAPIITAEQTATDKGKERQEVPFDGPYVKNTKKVTTDKSGAKHTAMSRVKHLAKTAARKQAGLKEEQEPEDSYEKTSTPARRSLSKTAGIVKDLAKNSKSSSKEKADTFQAEPELSSQIIKT
jgi:predicted RNA binding protein YcfA (HicA-like mRNA interferase family)